MLNTSKRSNAMHRAVIEAGGDQLLADAAATVADPAAHNLMPWDPIYKSSPTYIDTLTAISLGDSGEPTFATATFGPAKQDVIESRMELGESWMEMASLAFISSTLRKPPELEGVDAVEVLRNRLQAEGLSTVGGMMVTLTEVILPPYEDFESFDIPTEVDDQDSLTIIVPEQRVFIAHEAAGVASTFYAEFVAKAAQHPITQQVRRTMPPEERASYYFLLEMASRATARNSNAFIEQVFPTRM